MKLHAKALRDIAERNLFAPIIEKAEPQYRATIVVLFVEVALEYLATIVSPAVFAGHLYRIADHFAVKPDDRD
jgi:hypothetical protein